MAPEVVENEAQAANFARQGAKNCQSMQALHGMGETVGKYGLRNFPLNLFALSIHKLSKELLFIRVENDSVLPPPSYL
jgi:hypothetical protein